MFKKKNEVEKLIESYKHADIIFEGGIHKSGYVCITFYCESTLSTYILFSCFERNTRDQILLYAVRANHYFFTRCGYDYLDEMDDKEIEMIEDTIAEVCTKGLFHRRLAAVLDRDLKVEKVTFKE